MPISADDVTFVILKEAVNRIIIYACIIFSAFIYISESKKIARNVYFLQKYFIQNY